MLRERTRPRPFVDELPVDGSDRLNGNGRGSVPMIGGLTKPFGGGGIICRHALTFGSHDAQLVQGG